MTKTKEPFVYSIRLGDGIDYSPLLEEYDYDDSYDPDFKKAPFTSEVRWKFECETILHYLNRDYGLYEKGKVVTLDDVISFTDKNGYDFELEVRKEDN